MNFFAFIKIIVFDFIAAKDRSGFESFQCLRDGMRLGTYCADKIFYDYFFARIVRLLMISIRA